MSHILQPSNAGREGGSQVGMPPGRQVPFPAHGAPGTPSHPSFCVLVVQPPLKRAKLDENQQTLDTVNALLERGASRPAGLQACPQDLE